MHLKLIKVRNTHLLVLNFCLLTWFRFHSITILLSCLGFAIECLLDHIKDPAHTHSTEEVLEGDEGVSDTEKEGGEFEVDKEDDNTKVDKSMGSRDQVSFLVNNKNESSKKAGFGGAETKHDLVFNGEPSQV